MPTVPRYQLGQIRHQGVSARQSINTPSDAFGANVAQSIAQLGSQIGQSADVASEVAVKRQQDWDETVLRENDTALSTFIRDKLDDAQSGYFNLRGKDALNARADIEKEITEYEKSLRSNLDPRLSNEWGRLSNQRIQNAQIRISTHARTQFFTWEDEAYIARQLNQQSDAASHVGNQTAINQSIAVGLVDIDNQAEKRGWSGDALARKKLDFTTGAHRQVINRLIAQGKPSEADLYYRSNKDHIDPAQRDEIENSLRAHTNKAKAQRATDDIMANLDLDAAGQLAAARDIEDADVRAQVETMVTQRQAEQVRLITQAATDAEDEIMKQLAGGAQYEDLDAALMSRLDSSGRSRVTNYLRARAEALMKPDDPVAAKKAYYALRDQAHKHYADFKRTWNAQLYVGLLDESDIESLNNLAENETAAKSSVSVEAQMKMALGSLGLDYTEDRDENNTDGERIRAFIASVDNKIRGYVAEKGKEPDSATISQWIVQQATQNLVQVKLAGPLSKQRPLSTVTTDEMEDAYVTVNGQDVYLKDIPAVDRATIESNLRKRGMPVTEYSIADFYLRSQQRAAGGQ